jgi:hypothetical protein
MLPGGQVQGKFSLYTGYSCPGFQNLFGQLFQFIFTVWFQDWWDEWDWILQ